MSLDPQATDEQGAYSQPALSRRTIMKAIGAGAALSAMSRTAVAQQGNNTDLVRCRFGYPALATKNPPIEPDHEVELTI